MFGFEVFEYEFMVRALLVGTFTAVSAAMLGNFIVAARQAVVSDMLAHVALVGVGLGIFWQLSPNFLALGTTIIGALLLWWLSRSQRQAPEAIAMLLLTGGLATALLLTHLNKNNPVALETYLFGSILTISPQETWIFITLNCLIIALLIAFWRPFLTLAFDKDFLLVKGWSITYEILFMLLIALMVGVGLKVIGGFLIGALLVISVLIAQHFTHSFQHNVWGSVLINLLAVLIGVLSSFYIDIPASSGIVLSLIAFYLFAKVIAWSCFGKKP